MGKALILDQIQNRVDAFLQQYAMLPNSDLSTECQAFTAEMQAGLTDRPGTLKMLCTYIRTDRDIPVREPVIVMDAGGTNFRVALVTFDDQRQPLIEHFTTHPMPGTRGELSSDEFYAAIVSYLEPVIHRSNRIGFCFSFPTVITPDRDGLLLGFNKEVKVRDMENVLVGTGLKRALKAAGVVEDKQIVMLNDTVATLLGGKAASPGRVFSSYIGYILGTGTNTCYIENNDRLIKHPAVAAQPGSTIINIESGGFGRFARGEFDQRFDRTTADPGAQQLEKMVSGVYIGHVLFEVLRQAAVDGLFSPAVAARLNVLSSLSAKDIDDYCYYPFSVTNVLGSCINRQDNEAESPAISAKVTDTDRLTLYTLIERLIDRAARYSAINLAAVITQSGGGTDPCAPVLITAEGTTFYKLKLFRARLDYYVRTLINDQLGLYCEFFKVDNATLIGTAIAGLTN